jgi:hypothetical protein
MRTAQPLTDQPGQYWLAARGTGDVLLLLRVLCLCVYVFDVLCTGSDPRHGAARSTAVGVAVAKNGEGSLNFPLLLLHHQLASSKFTRRAPHHHAQPRVVAGGRLGPSSVLGRVRSQTNCDSCSVPGEAFLLQHINVSNPAKPLCFSCSIHPLS